MKQDMETSGPEGRRNDVVFDFSGIGSPDLGALCLVLTARNLADEDHRRVWLHALPESTWQLLHALGLEHYFELLPENDAPAN